jgi:hypothetical protein
MVDVIRTLEPIRRDDPISTHSSLHSREIAKNIQVFDWARPDTTIDRVERDTRRLFIILATKGPFIDKLLDQSLDYHECYFQETNVTSSSLAGAAYFSGVLVNLQNAADFAHEHIQVRFSEDGTVYQDIEIPSLTQALQVDGLRRNYVPSPKHAPGGWGTLMDLDNNTAQNVLDNGILDGKQVYNLYGGKYYTFQSDNVGGYHGYPVSRNEVPARIIRLIETVNNIS